jgi:excinuclease ABC subunit A
MRFHADVHVTCEVCGGACHSCDTPEVKYAGLSVADVLNLTVSEAQTFFRNFPALKEKLATPAEAGPGCTRLGRSAATLSGGEHNA